MNFSRRGASFQNPYDFQGLKSEKIGQDSEILLKWSLSLICSWEFILLMKLTFFGRFVSFCNGILNVNTLNRTGQMFWICFMIFIIIICKNVSRFSRKCEKRQNYGTISILLKINLESRIDYSSLTLCYFNSPKNCIIFYLKTITFRNIGMQL